MQCHIGLLSGVEQSRLFVFEQQPLQLLADRHY